MTYSRVSAPSTPGEYIFDVYPAEARRAQGDQKNLNNAVFLSESL